MSAGERLGSYEVLKELKTGGMATLFLGRRLGASGFARLVALKVIHPHLARDERFREMFIDEARICARIHHPNVVHVEELAEEGDVHFLAMEFVHGVSLAQLLKALAVARRRMLPELAVCIAIAAADGLHAAHETRGNDGALLNIVHRDVTPENILIAFHGHVKVIDFGVAKARDRVRETTAGTLKGKFGYMSPEHARAEPVDRRSDIYALGVVLWELLTMRRCLKAANDLALLDLAKHPQIPPPDTMASHIPPELSAVVMKALAPNPDDRFQTAQELRRALAAACPNAMALDAAHLSELLSSVASDEIEEERESVPESAMQEPVPRRTDPGEQAQVLGRFTVTGGDLIPSGGSSGDSSHGRATPTTPQRRQVPFYEEATPVQRVESPLAVTPPAAPRPSASAARPPSDSSRLLLAGLLVLAVALAALLGAGIGVMIKRRRAPGGGASVSAPVSSGAHGGSGGAVD